MRGPRPARGSRITRYYDSNTARFLLVGGSGRSYALHRQLWGEGVTSTEGASGHIHRLIEEAIRQGRPVGAPVILDMGCGVGGTLFHLADAFPRASLTGITISPKQHGMAERLAAGKGLGDRCRFVLGDFEREDTGVAADVVVAVESFAHSTSRRAFFRSAARQLTGGGMLLIADDFLTAEPESFGVRARRHIEDFRAGWHLPGLGTADACIRAGGRQGLRLEDDTELTGLIRLGRPRDRAIALLCPFIRMLGLGDVPVFGNMIGGHALQNGIREGILTYRLLRFRREPRA